MGRPLILLLLLWSPFSAVWAEAILLVQGYLGEEDAWRRSGVTATLTAAGWRDGGHLYVGTGGVRGWRPRQGAGGYFYTLSLPTTAPLFAQLRRLTPVVQALRREHAGESLHLVGHSAGGVLARLFLVVSPETHVSSLITIASPHLGTASAEAGLMAGDSPLGWVAPLFDGGQWSRSRGLYLDLAREHNGNLLFWLNRQPHPPVRYVSVIRRGGGLLGMGDLVVPEWSQDMNQILALRGRSMTLFTPGGHGLYEGDGPRLLDILRRLQQL